MTLWLFLILVLGLQGYCLGVQKNETKIPGHASSPLKSTESPPSTVLHAIKSELTTPPPNTERSITISTTPKLATTPTSNPRKGFKHSATASQSTTSPNPTIITTTKKPKIEPTTTEDTPTSKIPGQSETKIKSSLSEPVGSPTNFRSSQKPLVPTAVGNRTKETAGGNEDHESHNHSRKPTFPQTNVTRAIQSNTNRPEETSEENGAPTSATTESENGLATSTPAETSADEETSTLTFAEYADWPFSETKETTTENTDENNYFSTTTEISTDSPTTDWSTEQTTEDSTAEGPSISNGIASYENQPIPGVSSPLTKLILRLSKPGVFEKGRSVFEDDPSAMTTSCPPGDAGLPCRRAEARRTADECSGGNCEVCRSCNNMAATDWPHCCRENFRCCSELALACQQCDQPTLQVFCTKHFKRCF